jgi:KDO2-lipid IV(A) lauroyltransferase
MPELGEAERGKALSGMWDNLGRIIGEYPHMSRKAMTRRITIEGLEHLHQVRDSEAGALFISGHFANWEIAPMTAAIHGLPLVLIYRTANNPVANWLICRIRSGYNAAMYGKGREGAQQAISAIKARKAVGMLVDQKMNDGEAVPFFGRDAMTATAAISMAIKLQAPLLVARVVRTHGVHFHVTVQPPVRYRKDADTKTAMLELHHLFERWIRERPAQWFWVHRRWGK